MLNKLFSALLLAGVSATAAAAPYKLTLGEPVLNKQLSSASGLVFTQNALFAVGDDSPWLFTVNPDFTVKDKHMIKEFPMEENGRIQKKVKPDYEAMSTLNYQDSEWFLVLGSGSKADVREWAYLISADRKQQIERSLKPLYAQLYQASGFSGDQELNVEGIVTTPTLAYIFNRGNSGDNLIFSLPISELTAYMAGTQTAVKDLTTYRVKLPVVNEFEAGLSGGEFWASNNSLLYTASVEATGDAYNDGEILGSFIGVIPLDKLDTKATLDLTETSVPLLKGDKPIITKVESVAIETQTANVVSGALVSDNDDGTSEFFNFSLKK